MNTDPYKVSYDDSDPVTTIRTDLWPTMTLQQLAIQQDLVITKMTTMSSMLNGASPSLVGMYRALEQAMRDINFLIENRSAQKPTRHRPRP